jgi:hypothetical protein
MMAATGTVTTVARGAVAAGGLVYSVGGAIVETVTPEEAGLAQLQRELKVVSPSIENQGLTPAIQNNRTPPDLKP